MDLSKELQKFNLSDNEAIIYLALLKMGATPAGNVATYTKIKRSTTYLAIDNLTQLGLIAEYYKDKKRLFVAEPPSQLKKLTNRMRRKVVQNELLLDSLIPLLEELPKTTQSSGIPHLSFRAGINGIKNALLEVAASKDSWYVFGSSTKLLKNLPIEDLKEVLEEGEKLRALSGRPKIYFITDQGILSIPEFSKPDPKRREVKIIPKEIDSTSAYILFGDKIAILNINANPSAIVIDSKEIVDVMKVNYDLIWKSIKEPSK